MVPSAVDAAISLLAFALASCSFGAVVGRMVASAP
jgi:hypothetical protein